MTNTPSSLPPINYFAQQVMLAKANYKQIDDALADPTISVKPKPYTRLETLNKYLVTIADGICSLSSNYRTIKAKLLEERKVTVASSSGKTQPVSLEGRVALLPPNDMPSLIHPDIKSTSTQADISPINADTAPENDVPDDPSLIALVSSEPQSSSVSSPTTESQRNEPTSVASSTPPAPKTSKQKKWFSFPRISIAGLFALGVLAATYMRMGQAPAQPLPPSAGPMDLNSPTSGPASHAALPPSLAHHVITLPPTVDPSTLSELSRTTHEEVTQAALRTFSPTPTTSVNPTVDTIKDVHEVATSVLKGNPPPTPTPASPPPVEARTSTIAQAALNNSQTQENTTSGSSWGAYTLAAAAIGGIAIRARKIKEGIVSSASAITSRLLSRSPEVLPKTSMITIPAGTKRFKTIITDNAIVMIGTTYPTRDSEGDSVGEDTEILDAAAIGKKSAAIADGYGRMFPNSIAKVSKQASELLCQELDRAVDAADLERRYSDIIASIDHKVKNGDDTLANLAGGRLFPKDDQTEVVLVSHSNQRWLLVDIHSGKTYQLNNRTENAEKNDDCGGDGHKVALGGRPGTKLLYADKLEIIRKAYPINYNNAVLVGMSDGYWQNAPKLRNLDGSTNELLIDCQQLEKLFQGCKTLIELMKKLHQQIETRSTDYRKTQKQHWNI